MTDEKYDSMKKNMQEQVNSLREDLSNPSNFKINDAQNELQYMTILKEGDIDGNK